MLIIYRIVLCLPTGSWSYWYAWFSVFYQRSTSIPGSRTRHCFGWYVLLYVIHVIYLNFIRFWIHILCSRWYNIFGPCAYKYVQYMCTMCAQITNYLSMIHRNYISDSLCEYYVQITVGYSFPALCSAVRFTHYC